MSETKNITKKSLAEKIILIQLNIKAMRRNKKGYGYQYYDINQIIEVLKPLMKKYGLLIMQPLSHIEGKPALKTIIMSGSESMEWDTPLPTNQTSKTKNATTITETDPQRMGASITYYRRYALTSLLLLEAEDNDAQQSNKINKQYE